MTLLFSLSLVILNTMLTFRHNIFIFFVLLLVLSGQETTGNALAFAVILILQHRNVLSRYYHVCVCAYLH